MPEALRVIRNRYPASRGDARWVQVEKLVISDKPGEVAKAEALARQITAESPSLRVRAASIRAARKERRRFLRGQRDMESRMSLIFDAAADKMAVVIVRNAGLDGKVSIGRTRRVMAALEDLNREAYKAINSNFLKGLRSSASDGIKSAQKQAMAGIEMVKKVMQSEEGAALRAVQGWVELREVDPLRAIVDFGVGTTIFKRLFKGTLLDTMRAGLFGKKRVSNRIWDLRDENKVRLKRLVGAGIARGDSAAKISRDIRGILRRPATLRGFAFDIARPGAGVYRSAYKNALRVTRTETNRAFVLADVNFAAEKKWKLIWVVSQGQREFDSCDLMASQSARKPFTPEEFAEKYPQHPADLCYSVMVFPEIE